MFVFATRFHTLLLTVLAAITGVALYRIPADFVFPAHWGLHSAPDWTWPRNIALAVGPVVAVLLVLAFEAVARFMGKERLAFSQHILDPALTLLLIVIAAIQLGLLLIGIGSDLDLMRITVFGRGRRVDRDRHHPGRGASATLMPGCACLGGSGMTGPGNLSIASPELSLASVE